jgi:hypothetical protein
MTDNIIPFPGSKPGNLASQPKEKKSKQELIAEIETTLAFQEKQLSELSVKLQTAKEMLKIMFPEGRPRLMANAYDKGEGYIRWVNNKIEQETTWRNDARQRLGDLKYSIGIA